MAFDTNGLLHAQMLATLEYALDQEVDLDEFSTTVVIDGRLLQVEFTGCRIKKVERITAFRKECGLRKTEQRLVTKISFVTMFEKTSFIWDSQEESVTFDGCQAILKDYPKLTNNHLLDILTKAIVNSHESDTVRTG